MVQDPHPGFHFLPNSFKLSIHSLGNRKGGLHVQLSLDLGSSSQLPWATWKFCFPAPCICLSVAELLAAGFAPEYLQFSPLWSVANPGWCLPTIQFPGWTDFQVAVSPLPTTSEPHDSLLETPLVLNSAALSPVHRSSDSLHWLSLFLWSQICKKLVPESS